VAELIPEAELASVRGGHIPGPRAAARLAPLIERFVFEPLDEPAAQGGARASRS
jgi:hypothetical protein